MVAPAGRVRLYGDGVVRDSGLPDVVAASAPQHSVEDLPADTIAFLLAAATARPTGSPTLRGSLFAGTPSGWAHVKAICNYVHGHIAFGYKHVRPTKTAWEAFNEGSGVCRDYADLAISFCCCMNIPAR